MNDIKFNLKSPVCISNEPNWLYSILAYIKSSEDKLIDPEIFYRKVKILGTDTVVDLPFKSQRHSYGIKSGLVFIRGKLYIVTIYHNAKDNNDIAYARVDRCSLLPLGLIDLITNYLNIPNLSIDTNILDIDDDLNNEALSQYYSGEVSINGTFLQYSLMFYLLSNEIYPFPIDFQKKIVIEFFYSIKDEDIPDFISKLFIRIPRYLLWVIPEFINRFRNRKVELGFDKYGPLFNLINQFVDDKLLSKDQLDDLRNILNPFEP